MGACVSRGAFQLLLLLEALNQAMAQSSRTRADRFKKVYAQNLWQSGESRSGKGSEKVNAAADARFILSVVRKRFSGGVGRANVTIIDAPCGDMNWMPDLLIQLEKEFSITYHGYDIVADLVKAHHSRFSTRRNWHFWNMDVVDATPKSGDILISRDLLNHLPLADAQRVLSNIKATHTPTLIISNNRDVAFNRQLKDMGGGSHKLNLELPPFNWRTAITGNGHLWLWDTARQWDEMEAHPLGRADPSMNPSMDPNNPNITPTKTPTG